MSLPALPGHRLVVVLERRHAADERPFVELRHLRMEARFADGTRSSEFGYDVAHRSRLDAVVVAPYHHRDGTTYVLLRSALRPPLTIRTPDRSPIVEKASLGELWEVPAGLVEEDERTPEGLVACAARELLEETGYEVGVDRIEPLGPPTFPSPGIIGERHFFFSVEVDPARRGAPPEDGSALEHAASLVEVPLAEALEACRTGEIEDAKTELALRRLAERLERSR
jgi:ADP-ribose pyrophosphatase